MNFFRKKYRQWAFQVYAAGKQEYEIYHEQQMMKKGKVGEGTRFYPESELLNLSGDTGRIEISKNCHISGLMLVYAYGGAISIGDNCSLSPYSRIVSTKKIAIGNRVLIAHNVNIIDNISHPIDAGLRHEDFIKSYTTGMQEYDLKAEEITIEDDVWIGFNSSILRGVTIGRGAIIGSGSVVTKDVKAWTVNVGNPLRCIRELDPVDI